VGGEPVREGEDDKIVDSKERMTRLLIVKRG
jgi:hypothetical protein